MNAITRDSEIYTDSVDSSVNRRDIDKSAAARDQRSNALHAAILPAHVIFSSREGRDLRARVDQLSVKLMGSGNAFTKSR